MAMSDSEKEKRLNELGGMVSEAIKKLDLNWLDAMNVVTFGMALCVQDAPEKERPEAAMTGFDTLTECIELFSERVEKLTGVPIDNLLVPYVKQHMKYNYEFGSIPKEEIN